MTTADDLTPYYDPNIWREMPPVTCPDGHTFTPHHTRKYIYHGPGYWGRPVECVITLVSKHHAGDDVYVPHALICDDVYDVPDFVHLSQLTDAGNL